MAALLQKQCTFKVLLISFFMVMSWKHGLAQSKPISKAIPDYAILQYAGSIGAYSIGFGYKFGKKKRLALEGIYSNTPKFQGTESLDAITCKFFYQAFDTISIPKVKPALYWTPLRIGSGVSYIADSHFFSFKTDLPYESGYYWHKTGLRALALFQSELALSLKSKHISSVSTYFEANIQDLYITLYVADRDFTFMDMIRFGIGGRIYIK